MSDHERGGRSTGLSGHRLVLALYAVIVGVATLAGYLTGSLVDDLRAPALLFLVELPPTPLGMALYGGVTVALVLGVPLALIVYISRDAEGPGRGRRPNRES